MKDSIGQPTGNRILDALPLKDFQRLAKHLEPIVLPGGYHLYHLGARMKQVYFPTSGMVSLVSESRTGASVEVGIIGREGMAGISTVLGIDETPHRTMVQLPGEGIRLETSELRSEFQRGGALHDLLLRFLHSTLLQISQAASCNRLHPAEARLARWLLMSSDRTGLSELPLTQEFLSYMLGTRRAGVTEIAIGLQKAGLIKYSRGRINILDKEALKKAACECYGIINRELARLNHAQAT